MKNTSRIRTEDQGFTLIELLTVIAIIAILMGLLFPAVSAVKDAAKKAEAKNACTGIVAAVKQYNAEYGKYPPLDLPAGKPGEAVTDALIGDPATKAKVVNNVLFNTLRNIDAGPNKDYKLNPRKIVFLEGKAVSDPTSPRSGFLDKGGEAANLGCYFDPWGTQYNVIIDTDYNNFLDVDQVYEKDKDWAKDGRPHVGVGAFSLGKNKVIGGDKKDKLEGIFRDGQKVSDDVDSWQ